MGTLDDVNPIRSSKRSQGYPLTDLALVCSVFMLMVIHSKGFNIFTIVLLGAIIQDGGIEVRSDP